MIDIQAQAQGEAGRGWLIGIVAGRGPRMDDFKEKMNRRDESYGREGGWREEKGSGER